MPGNDVRRSHSSVRTTIKQCSGDPRQLLSKCQHQPRQQSLKATRPKDFVLYLSRPHFPQALSGTWQQVTWQPLLYKMASGIISENKWIFFKPAGSPGSPAPAHPTPPNQKSEKTKYYNITHWGWQRYSPVTPGGQAWRVTDVPWNPLLGSKVSHAVGRGGWTSLLDLSSKKT